MTAGDRLRQLAGRAGVAGTLLLLIGSGANAGAALVDSSCLVSGTAVAHLLDDRACKASAGGGGKKRRNDPRWPFDDGYETSRFDDVVLQPRQEPKPPTPKSASMKRKARDFKDTTALADRLAIIDVSAKEAEAVHELDTFNENLKAITISLLFFTSQEPKPPTPKSASMKRKARDFKDTTALADMLATIDVSAKEAEAAHELDTFNENLKAITISLLFFTS